VEWRHDTVLPVEETDRKREEENAEAQEDFYSASGCGICGKLGHGHFSQ
jgi:hypothetical protein